MQYFPVDDFSGEVPALPETVKPFVHGHYVRDGQVWTVISMEALYEHDVFQQIAV
jgi:twitching motility protein PilI